TVTSEEDGFGLPGVTVVLKGTTTGGQTDFDGNYSFEIPSEGGLLVFSFVGMTTQEVEIGSKSVVDIIMSTDVKQLTEVVVTGVATGISAKKLGFSVSKVNKQALEAVPATDAGNALRGKAAGVRIVQASGNPTSSSSIRLRGSTNISGSQSPLIIVDGIITDGSISDINMEDVESIEILKGAAASSLYGSLAGNGVIQILTKRGAIGGKPTISLRSEFGFSEIGRAYPTADKHSYKLDENGEFLLLEGKVQVDEDGLLDNPFPRYNNNAKNLFGSQPWRTISASVGQTGDKFNYYASFQDMHQQGVIKELDPYKRQSVKLNADLLPNDKWKVKTSVSYTKTTGIDVVEQGQSPNLFYGVLIYSPYLNLAEKDPETGLYAVRPDGFDVIDAGNFRNPFYDALQVDRSRDRDRYLGGAEANYKPFEWLSLTGGYSLDKSVWDRITFYPQGFETPSPSSTLNNGYYRIRKYNRSTSILSFQSTAKKQFGKFNTALSLKYILENRMYSRLTAEGYDFIAKGVISLDNGKENDVSSYFQEEIAENYFVNFDLDYNDKLIFNGMLRRDGSSMFGEDARYALYYRGSLAYRLSEDFNLPGINEFKLRASYGTSGQRPYAWAAQYETFDVTDAGISPDILGNVNLKPSVVSEFETGINIDFLGRFSAEITYAYSTTKDDILLVPLSPVSGYTAQYQNAADLKQNSFEVSINGDVIQGKKMKWNVGLNFDTNNTIITGMTRPPFTRNTATALQLFRVEEGLPYGTIFGNSIVTDVNQLTLDANGFVMNDKSYTPGGENNTTINDYFINEDGYVVRKDYYNTGKEQALLKVDEKGTPVVEAIGNTNPKFNLGLTSNLSYNGFTFYTLFDYQHGGDIYNNTKQLLFFEDRHLDQVKYAEIGKHRNYSGGASTLYNANNAISHFVEDGSFLKIREISLSYKIDNSKSNFLGGFFKTATFAISGRNLFTITKYSGWDPEVALGDNPTNFRIDEFSYPNFRTYTGSVKLTF
ncbi:SusC/RagA family TonB-linked outer membrane protein, partial [Xanthovirga aplysinae]|uniref:SusC/RagA family TonB-linked outer membrane protein n=1 Tax=Xanthovirga aplysinae TaxID=2529853 RepID=UPI0012BBCFCA